MLAWQKLVWGTVITTLGWLGSAWVFPPENDAVLAKFVAQTGVSGPGWPQSQAGDASLASGLLQAFLGCVAVYAVLMATGCLLYGKVAFGSGLGVLAVAAGVAVFGVHRSRA